MICQKIKKFTVAGTRESKEIDDINSVQSSLKSPFLGSPVFPKSCRKCSEQILRNHFDPEGDGICDKSQNCNIFFKPETYQKNAEIYRKKALTR